MGGGSDSSDPGRLSHSAYFHAESSRVWNGLKGFLYSNRSTFEDTNTSGRLRNIHNNKNNNNKTALVIFRKKVCWGKKSHYSSDRGVSQHVSTLICPRGGGAAHRKPPRWRSGILFRSIWLLWFCWLWKLIDTYAVRGLIFSPSCCIWIFSSCSSLKNPRINNDKKISLKAVKFLS